VQLFLKKKYPGRKRITKKFILPARIIAQEKKEKGGISK
jgi:hypothetical protein